MDFQRTVSCEITGCLTFGATAPQVLERRVPIAIDRGAGPRDFPRCAEFQSFSPYNGFQRAVS